MSVLISVIGATHIFCDSGTYVVCNVRPVVLLSHRVAHTSLSRMFGYRWLMGEVPYACVHCFWNHSFSSSFDCRPSDWDFSVVNRKFSFWFADMESCSSIALEESLIIHLLFFREKCVKWLDFSPSWVLLILVGI